MLCVHSAGPQLAYCKKCTPRNPLVVCFIGAHCCCRLLYTLSARHHFPTMSQSSKPLPSVSPSCTQSQQPKSSTIPPLCCIVAVRHHFSTHPRHNPINHYNTSPNTTPSPHNILKSVYFHAHHYLHIPCIHHSAHRS